MVVEDSRVVIQHIIPTGPVRAESAKFEAEQLTKSTDGVAIPELWKQIFPPQICQVLL